MTALTVGITTARNPACKRGIAVNIAASLARGADHLRVCVVDADPLTLDVSTRLTVRGPVLEDFAERTAPPSSQLGSVHEPPLWVLPSAGAGVGLTHRAAERALTQLREDFDVVICDLVAGPSGPARVVGGRLEQLDWLLVAMTPEAEPVTATAHLLDQFEHARSIGEIADTVGIGVVATGDECSVELAPDVVTKALGRPVLGSIPQLWGHAVPNLGFGAALGIAEFDDAVSALLGRLGGDRATTVGSSAA